MSGTQTHHVEFSGMQVPSDGEGFLLECRDREQHPVRLQFPSWALYQLMRVWPRIEAAMHHRRSGISSSIVAHPVIGWSVERSGLDCEVAVCLRNDQHVESGFIFDIDGAKAFRRELDEAIELAVRSLDIASATSSIN